MKLDKNLLYANALLLLVLGLWGGISIGSSGIGLALIGVGILNIPLLFIFLLLKNKVAVKTCLLVFGVFLLVGFSICSISSFGLR
jgi:hypothetical protein